MDTRAVLLDDDTRRQRDTRDGPDMPAWNFDDLVREGLSLIPAYAPQWNNYNPSDPGITLVELLAYISEALDYRAARITPDAKLNFLRLLLEVDEQPFADHLLGAPMKDIDEAIRTRVEILATAHCAITPSDFERLAIAAARERLGDDARVGAVCLPGIDLRRAVMSTSEALAADAPADVSVLLVPVQELSEDATTRLCRHVQGALEPNCLLTTRLHVVGPATLHVQVGCRLALRPGTTWDEVIAEVEAALARRFGAAQADASAQARSVGQPLFLSAIAQAIDDCEGIDYVEDVEVWRLSGGSGEDAGADVDVGLRIGIVARPGLDARLGGRASLASRRLQRDDALQVESLRLFPWERARVRLAPDGVHEILGDDDPGRRPRDQ